MNRLRVFALVVVLAAPALAAAADWPQWLGPRRDGTSSETIKPWTTLKVVWKKKVGPGHSSPVVAGGKVYLHTRGKDRKEKANGKEVVEQTEELTAYDAASGEQAWSTPYVRGAFFSVFGTGPQATPAVKDGKVYAHGATGMLTCFDAQKGQLLWKVSTKKEFDAPALRFGVACSPLLDGKNVVVDVGGKGASVVAFTQAKGEVVWKLETKKLIKGKSRDDGASYSSGIAVGKGKGRELVFLTQQGLRGLDPADGKQLWEHPLVDGLDESATTPVVAGDLLLASSITTGMTALRLTKGEGKPAAAAVWKNPKLSCYFSTPIPVGKGHVYAVTGTLNFLSPTSTLHCIETATGKVVWSKPKVGKFHAAMLKTADGKLLMLSDLGELVLIDPDPKGYKALCQSKVGKGEQIWAHPALANGKVYFRDEKELYCLQMPE
jgi:outer membrane protein assembly factor BamB